MVQIAECRRRMESAGGIRGVLRGHMAAVDDGAV
jgi:hypothetical protein